MKGFYIRGIETSQGGRSRRLTTETSSLPCLGGESLSINRRKFYSAKT